MKWPLKVSGKYERLEQFPLVNLEEEYDYSTEEEQVVKAKKHMHKEGYQAIEFFVRDDPILLVENFFKYVKEDNNQ